MLLAVHVAADNERGPRFMQEAFAAMHQANHARVPIALEYGCHEEAVGLYLRVPGSFAPVVVAALSAKYPQCALEPLEDVQALQPPSIAQSCTVVADLRLAPDLFPILRHSQFEDIAGRQFADPIDAILRAVEPDAKTQARVVMTIIPTSHRRHRWAQRAVEILNEHSLRADERASMFYARTITHPWLWPLGWLYGAKVHRHSRQQSLSPVETTTGRHHEREDDVQAASDKIGGHLFDVAIRVHVSAASQHVDAARQRLYTLAGAFGSFTVSRLATFQMRPVRSRPRRSQFLLSHEELATLWHPPTPSVDIPHIRITPYTHIEAPSLIHTAQGAADGVALGLTKFRGQESLACLRRDDRRRHLYIVGKTGMGKTTLLEHHLVSDIRAGRGVCLIDPHGDLADRVLAAIPTARTNDVIVLDPSDTEYAVAYNPLLCSDPERRDLVADDVLSAFAKVYDLSQTPRLKDTLRNALYVLIEKQLTLLDLLMLLADEHVRREVLRDIEDDLVRMFWQSEFPAWGKTYRTEALSAVQNKVRPFLMNRRIRAIVGQRGKSLNLRRIMDEGQVLIVNLSKGKLGEYNASLLGALLVSGIQQAAVSRADSPEVQRRDFYLYVDEFQNFTTGSFAAILSEARKYRLNLTIAHQYLKQLDERTAEAVFGNVGSMLAFQVGAEDAETLTQQLERRAGQLQPRDFTSLPKYTAYARVLVDGMPVGPFSLTTLAPIEVQEDRQHIVRAASRRQHARHVTSVPRDMAMRHS